MPLVLLIDADPPSVKLERVVLEAEGWVVVSVRSPAAARDVLRAFQIQLIVLDLVPPREAALEAIRELAALAPAIPILAVTSLNGPETEYRALEAGCIGFIRKPIEVSIFPAQLNRFLGGVP